MGDKKCHSNWSITPDLEQSIIMWTSKNVILTFNESFVSRKFNNSWTIKNDKNNGFWVLTIVNKIPNIMG